MVPPGRPPSGEWRHLIRGWRLNPYDHPKAYSTVIRLQFQAQLLLACGEYGWQVALSALFQRRKLQVEIEFARDAGFIDHRPANLAPQIPRKEFRKRRHRHLLKNEGSIAPSHPVRLFRIRPQLRTATAGHKRVNRRVPLFGADLEFESLPQQISNHLLLAG